MFSCTTHDRTSVIYSHLCSHIIHSSTVIYVLTHTHTHTHTTHHTHTLHTPTHTTHTPHTHLLKPHHMNESFCLSTEVGIKMRRIQAGIKVILPGLQP